MSAIFEAVSAAKGTDEHSDGVRTLGLASPPTNQQIIDAVQKAYGHYQPAVDAGRSGRSLQELQLKPQRIAQASERWFVVVPAIGLKEVDKPLGLDLENRAIKRQRPINIAPGCLKAFRRRSSH